eukprot:3337754-Heterocapsa_arctica.AAC.1
MRGLPEAEQRCARERQSARRVEADGLPGGEPVDGPVGREAAFAREEEELQALRHVHGAAMLNDQVELPGRGEVLEL